MSIDADDFLNSLGPMIEEVEDEKGVEQAQNQLVPAQTQQVVATQPNITIQKGADFVEGLALILQQHWTPEQSRHVALVLAANLNRSGVEQYARGPGPIYMTTAAGKAIEAIKDILLVILNKTPFYVWAGVITYCATFYSGFLRAVNSWYYEDAQLLEKIAEAHDASVKQATMAGGGTAVVQSQWFQQVGIGMIASAATAVVGYSIRAVTGM